MRFLVLLLIVLCAAYPVRAHPQDGPHAEIRLAIEDERVTYSVNLNLAFMDEIIPISRESLGALSPREAERLEQDLRAYLIENATVTIDGQPARPVIDSMSISNDPELGMIALYPRVGARGLIRALTIMHFPCDAPPDTVVFGWADYPNEILIEEGQPKPMFLEAQLRAEGAVGIVRFSQAEPEVTWIRGESGVLFDVVPPLPEPVPGDSIRLLTVVFGILGIALLFGASTAPDGKVLAVFSIPAGASILAAVISLGAGPTITLAQPRVPPLEEARAEAVFEALLTNLYKSFEYTSESDIYDALAQSVEGDLLAELYDQVYRSLVQAENDGMVGVVTGIEPLSFELADASPGGGFETEFRWRVEGTVYHWGHTHTRTHEYHARYAVAPTDNGWRIVAQDMIDQQRIDDGLGDATAPPIGEL